MCWSVWKTLDSFLITKMSWKPLSSVIIIVLLFLLFWGIYHFLPPYRFTKPVSTVVFDRNGELLGARIATDGQWRFPVSLAVPEKFKICLIEFEDQYYYRHPGINPLSIVRATYQNLRAGKVVSGGSTITMQLIRLSREARKRDIFQKMIEAVLAVYSEIHFSKDENLRQYVSAAPFGGNVVGLEAAAWRYFGRSANNLSWAESACLAVLPNAPSLIHPGRNRAALKTKRDYLLDRLYKKGKIDKETFELSLLENLPEKPFPLPETATHLVGHLAFTLPENQFFTTIHSSLQNQIFEIVERHHKILESNKIHNIAALVLDTRSGEVLSYIGNTKKSFPGDHGNHVDIIQRPRSSGSLLKPILYAVMLSEGEIMPEMLVPDIPTTISNFSPKNFNNTYDGAVTAREALIRSLNIPAVRMLKDFGVERFYQVLKNAGFSSINRGSENYGLSLILGGAEITLWDVCGIYRAMAFKLLEYDNQLSKQKITLLKPMLLPDGDDSCEIIDLHALDEAAIYLTLDAMREVHRPEAEIGWEWFSNSGAIAWKTGTSFGFRDAWSVGITPDHVVGVWVGNADGEGRPGLTGINTAAPLMFEIFNILPAKTAWFAKPWDKMESIAVCRQSGMRVSQYCTDIDSIWVNSAALNSAPCPYHKQIHLDQSEQYKVNAECYPFEKILTKSWFELPPAMAFYYKARNPFYRQPPPWLPGCYYTDEETMQIVWPDKPTRIFIPREIDSTVGEVVFEVAHSRPDAIVFWYLNDEFIGQTNYFHKKGFRRPTGKYKLLLMDESGNILSHNFEIVNK
jgi:penicillin-binding protein 1C